MSNKEKKRMFAVDKDARKERRAKTSRVERTFSRPNADGEKVELKQDFETSLERAESLQIASKAVQAFLNSVEFYKSEWGGKLDHEKAFQEALELNEHARGAVKNMQPKQIAWRHIMAVTEADALESLEIWGRVRDAADIELESGWRAAEIVGGFRAEPFEIAQFLSIRDSFADQWQPQGGIESALIDMMAVAYSLQMYWSETAHRRAVQIHNNERGELRRAESKGWKSPYQYEADAVEQAHRMADGYNRQFLRVLRQLRDLRRYSPVVIQNNGGQVNVATDGGQQVNVKQE